MDTVLMLVALASANSLDAPSYRAREAARGTLERLPSAPVSVALASVEPSQSVEVRQAVAQLRLRMRARLVTELAADRDRFVAYLADEALASKPWRVAHEIVELLRDRGDWFAECQIAARLFPILAEKYPGPWHTSEVNGDGMWWGGPNVNAFPICDAYACYTDLYKMVMLARLHTDGSELSPGDW